MSFWTLRVCFFLLRGEAKTNLVCSNDLKQNHKSRQTPWSSTSKAATWDFEKPARKSKSQEKCSKISRKTNRKDRGFLKFFFVLF